MKKFCSISTTAVILLGSSTNTQAQLSTTAIRHQGLRTESDAGRAETPKERKLDEQLSMEFDEPLSMQTMASDGFDSEFIANAEYVFGPSSKAGKQGKKELDPLVAFIKPVPIQGRRLQANLAEDVTPYGIASIRYNADGSFLLALDMAGLAASSCLDPPEEQDPGDCKMAIHSGTSCAAHGSDYWRIAKLSSNPWSNIHYTAYTMDLNPEKKYEYSNSAERVYNGYGSAGNEGRVVVLTDSGGNVIACGVLQKANKSNHLDYLKAAAFRKYPGYTGPLSISGAVVVSFNTDGTFKFEYDFQGLEPNCQDCGVHIHTGVTCAMASDVGGHYWNVQDTSGDCSGHGSCRPIVRDLWTTEGGAVYNSDSKGKAKGFFQLSDGYSMGRNYHHAVVVHGSDGTRLACATLEGELN